MDLHRQLIVRAQRQVLVAAALAAFLGALSLYVAVRTWIDRMFIDLQIIFGITDALVVLVLAAWLRKMKMTPVALLIALGVAGLAYTFYEGAPVIAFVPTLIALAFYVRAASALRYLARVDPGPGRGRSVKEQADV